jgi:hypothetical protein
MPRPGSLQPRLWEVSSFGQHGYRDHTSVERRPIGKKACRIRVQPTKMRSNLTLAAVVAALALADLSARAHHSPSMFDQGRDLTLEGVIRRVEWANPHVYIHLEVENERRESAVWVVEAQSPRVMGLFGWVPTSLVEGDRVTVAVNPPRNGGTRTVLGRSVIRQDGTILRIPWQPREIREVLRAESPGRR